MRIDELISEAADLFKKGDFKGSIHKLNHGLILDPQNEEIKRILLGVYIETEDIDSALASVEDLLKEHPDEIELLQIKANCLSDSRNLDESIELYDKILTIQSDFYQAIGGRGAAKLKKGIIDEAFADFNVAIKNIPDNAFLYYQRAAIYSEKQNFQLALKDLNKSLGINKEFKPARLLRAFVLRMLGQYGKALKEIETVKDIIEDSESWHQKGIIHLKNNDFYKAMENYNRAIDLDDCNVEALYSRAMLFAKNNDFIKAFIDLDKSMQCENNHFKDFLLNGYADVYRKMKEFKKAIDFAEKSLSHNKDFYFAHITLAEIYGELGETELFYSNLKKGLDSGFDLNDIDDIIKAKYFKDKQFKAFLKGNK
jgi:tetratricopeptide (TPR) repeat protein